MSVPNRPTTTRSDRSPSCWLIVPATIAILAALLVVLPSMTDRLATGGWIPSGAESVHVNHLLASEFGHRATSHLILLEPARGDASFASPDHRREAARLAGELAAVPGVSRVFTPLDAPTTALRESLVGIDDRTWLAVVQVEDDLPESIERLPEIEAALRSDLLDARVTGVPALSGEFADQLKRDLLRAELIAFAVALAVLARFAGGIRQAAAIVLSTVTALAALMVAVATLSRLLPINIFALSVAAMLTIALSLDFGLLATIGGNRVRTRATMRIAAGAVIVGMAGLTLLPLDATRSIGGVSIAAVGIVALTQRYALPTWLALLGAGHRPSSIGSEPPSRWLRQVGRHPIIALLLGLAIVAPLVAPIASMRSSGPGVDLLPADSLSTVALEDVRERFPAIAVTPISIIATPSSGSMLDADNLFALRQTEERLAAIPGVRSVRTVWSLVPAGISSPMLTASLALDPTLVDQASPLLSERGAVIEIDADPGAGPTLVERIRAQAAPLTDGELRLQVGGTDAGSVDLLASIGDVSRPAAVLVIVATVLVLMMALRSVVLPLKAVVLNAIPVLAGLGAVTLLFQLDTPLHRGSGSTVVLVPLVLTWLMFGISMDYEVFMLARVRELHERGLGNREATLGGIAAARTVVLRGAVLMGIVFLAFGLSEIAVVRAIGVGMLVAIVVDATVVRLLLLPASMVLLGRWNWWWPSRLATRDADPTPATTRPTAIGDRG